MASETKYSLPRVMTVKELSDYLRVHPSTVYKLLRRGELPGFRTGTDWRFNAEVIQVTPAISAEDSCRHSESRRPASSLRTPRRLIRPGFLLTNRCAAAGTPSSDDLFIGGFSISIVGVATCGSDLIPAHLNAST